jgi:hypothetical protein
VCGSGTIRNGSRACNVDRNKSLSVLKTCSCIKALFIIPTNVHNYKITGMLKQLKFRQLLLHVSVHAGTIIRELFRVRLKLQL